MFINQRCPINTAFLFLINIYYILFQYLLNKVCLLAFPNYRKQCGIYESFFLSEKSCQRILEAISSDMMDYIVVLAGC